MRISDWSSDVCSSDLWSRRSASQSTRPVAATPGPSSELGSALLAGGTAPAGEHHDFFAAIDPAHVLAGQPGVELGGREGPAEQVALALLTAVGPQQVVGLGALHALGDRVRSEEHQSEL